MNTLYQTTVCDTACLKVSYDVAEYVHGTSGLWGQHKFYWSFVDPASQYIYLNIKLLAPELYF